jgi:hypothetical protein
VFGDKGLENDDFADIRSAKSADAYRGYSLGEHAVGELKPEGSSKGEN